MGEETLVGIDLGTTNSAIATLDRDGRPEVLANAEGSRITPSVVQIQAGGTTLVGGPARRELALEKENTAQFFKRDMGTSTRYEYRERHWTPVELSAEVLKKLKRDAETALGRPVRRAVISVPAYFQDAARLATKAAGELAGLEVVQTINEPTAAALAYGYKQTAQRETLLVYDLGGGTFDITLVEVTPEGIRVVGTDGNHRLGGKDWDDRLVEYVAAAFRRRHRVDPLQDAYTYQELQAGAEEAKKALSSLSRTAVAVNCQDKMERIEITREQFEALTRDLLSQTEMLVVKVLEETGYDAAQLSGALMVGGSTRMPACQALMRRLTGKPPNTSVNPDECVAIGAALQASEYRAPAAGGLVWGRRIGDVMSHSMGMIAVSADGTRYLNSILIPKNRPIPCREVRPYTARTAPKTANEVAVFVTQGEGEDPANCSFVGKYTLRDIPHRKEGVAILDIAYEYDRSGVVSVSAVERAGQKPLSIQKEADVGDTSWIFRRPREGALGHKTVYAAVDLSGSMSGEPLARVQEALIAFFQKLDLAHTSVGLISFADRVSVDREAIQDARLLEQTVRAWRIGPVGGGNSTDPFEDALRLLRGVEGPRFLVVLTDGIWAWQDKAAVRAEACHREGIEIIAIGFGHADKDFLRRLTTTDESALFVSTKELAGAFSQIAQVLVEGGIRRGGPGLAVRHGK